MYAGVVIRQGDEKGLDKEKMVSFLYFLAGRAGVKQSFVFLFISILFFLFSMYERILKKKSKNM